MNCPPSTLGRDDEIRTRLDSHYVNKDFWDWGYALVSKGSALNRAHTTWLEYALINRAHEALQCHLDNGYKAQGTEPLGVGTRQIRWDSCTRYCASCRHRCQGVREARPVGVRGWRDIAPQDPADKRDTVVVPAMEEGFQEVFIGENCWYAIRISGGMLQRIKYIAAYRTAPVSAITHYAPVERIEPYGEGSKYRLVFSEPAKEIPAIPFGNAVSGMMQGPRYTTLTRLLAASSVATFFGANPVGATSPAVTGAHA